jgi:nucleotide-binding universal stress UspA family protein
LLDAAEQVHADLIVVGTRGLRSSARLLLGSVSAAVIGQAKCPVTVIP